MGNFYKINPHLVIINGVTRGDFGIHKSPSAENDETLGCIGLLTDTGWNGFEENMRAIANAGVAQIPLVVVYSGTSKKSDRILIAGCDRFSCHMGKLN